ncbi:MAG: Gfo/Idh/MocA family oxidoreductase [Pseudomonadota bacterium]
MSPLRLLLVGLGARARTWMQVIAASRDAEIVAACDPDPKARARAAEAHRGLPIGADLMEIIGVGADAVLLATPPGGRRHQIEACCRAGLPVLAEKPLADDLADAARYVDMAEAAGVMLIVGLNFRYLAVTEELCRLLRTGAIGAPGFARFTYERWRDGTQARLNTYPLHMRHPMLWEQSIHHFDLMRYVYGAEPLHIQAHTWNPAWTMYAHNTNVSALIAFEGGLNVNYQGTWQAGHEPMHFDWRTDGAEGIVVQRAMFGDLAWAKRRVAELTPVPLPPHTPWITDAAALFARFVQMVRGEIAPECTGRDHLRSLQMLGACIRASERRSCVTIEEIAADMAAKEIT